MNAVAIGYGLKSRSSNNQWNVKASLIQNHVLPKGNSSSNMLYTTGRVQADGFPAHGGASRQGAVIYWFYIWTCWHRVAPCWGYSSRRPRGWSCNVSMPTCWTRAGVRRTRWTEPLGGGAEKKQNQVDEISILVFLLMKMYKEWNCGQKHRLWML